MCSLQPLKCPHEARELFVSLEDLQGPECERSGRVMPLSCFHHDGTSLRQHREEARPAFQPCSVHEGEGLEGGLGSSVLFPKARR